MWDFLERILASVNLEEAIAEAPEEPSGTGEAKTVRIRIPPEIYFTEMALYTARNIIAKAVSSCEFRVFRNNKEDRTAIEYFLLNEAPNRNQNATEFWCDVVNKVLGKDNSALVIEANSMLFVADSYITEHGRPIMGNIYSGVVLKAGNEVLQLNRKYRAEDCMLFKLDNENYSRIINGLMSRYSDLISTAVTAFKTDGGSKFKIHIDAEKQGDEKFIEEFEDKISGQLQDFIEPGTAVFVEFEGYDLTETSKASVSSVSAKNILDIKESMFNAVADSLLLPRALMNGNINNVDDVVKEALTFAIDPFAKMIRRTLNKYSGYEEYKAGNRYDVYTGAIKHHDILDSADNLDKLIASGTTNQDENRELVGLPALNTESSRTYLMTKNYGKIDNVLREGEENA